MKKRIIISLAFILLFSLITFCCCADEKTFEESQRKKINLQKEGQIKIEGTKGKKLVNIIKTEKSIELTFEDGTIVTISSVSHHTAGSHLEIK